VDGRLGRNVALVTAVAAGVTSNKQWYVLGILALTALVILLSILPLWYPKLSPYGDRIAWLLTSYPMQVALVLIAFLLIAYGLMSGSMNPLRLAMGEDGKLSTSKFQFLLWTLPVIFVVASLMFARKAQVVNIPPNVLVALGFSLTTLVGAKGITVSYKAANRIQKAGPPPPGAAPPEIHPADLFLNDRGQPDLTKAQMLAWTVVAIAEFLYNFFLNFGCYVATTQTAPCPPNSAGGFPDIDTTLMVLMGLGQGTYLGGKLVSTETPQITKVTATAQPATVSVSIDGEKFAGGTITINGVTPTKTTWKPDGTNVQAEAPNPLAGKTIAKGDTVDVAGTINDVAFANKVPVT
jgi:hypothetical protein